MENCKEYRELTLEEKMKVYKNYQKWFSTLSKKEQECIDNGGFDSFEEFHYEAYRSNLLYNTKTFEAE